MKSPIHSVKHYVHNSTATTATGVLKVFTVVKGENVIANAQDVIEGAVVKAIYIEWWLLGQGATGEDTQINCIIEKVTGVSTAITAAQMVNLGAYPNKKNIFFAFQGVVGDKFTNSIPIYRGWLKIPRGKQRIGLDDKFVMTTLSTGQSMQTCGFSTYKEYQ